MPREYRLNSETTERCVADYIAGMTDQYALRLAEELRGKRGDFKF
jgi:dGTP triphosphohydrolase